MERARNLDLFLMEAIWVRFLPSIKRLRDVIREGTIGTVKYIHLSFGNFARQGRNESNVMPLDETIATMKLMDAMRAEWDFRYPFE